MEQSPIKKYRVLADKTLIHGDEIVYLLKIDAKDIADSARPGQFVNVYMDDSSKLLPRPISIADAEDGVLTLVIGIRGKGTAYLHTKKSGDYVRIMGPLGTGFLDAGDVSHELVDSVSSVNLDSPIASVDVTNLSVRADLRDASHTEHLDPATKHILIGGGIGVPPMRLLAKTLAKSGVKPDDICVVLGYRDEPFYENGFYEITDLVYETSDRDNRNVVDALNDEKLTSGIIYACGPTPMLKAVKSYAQLHEMKLLISLEERMGCGYGACVGCTVKTTAGKKKVCKDGPVFDASEVVL
ncbi:MAG: dihydroorotate dehydrogenase electron transfer subunit [Clostridiales Family XIII bacterium]|jgi:dihydroorotate dehydrogenase electron transfer subunit|nr:dihydroorotate dehydrogenase electron transfer subunit [Clostridiales Family XIII bacterium]